MRAVECGGETKYSRVIDCGWKILRLASFHPSQDASDSYHTYYLVLATKKVSHNQITLFHLLHFIQRGCPDTTTVVFRSTMYRQSVLWYKAYRARPPVQYDFCCDTILEQIEQSKSPIVRLQKSQTTILVSLMPIAHLQSKISSAATADCSSGYCTPPTAPMSHGSHSLRTNGRHSAAADR